MLSEFEKCVLGFAERHALFPDEKGAVILVALSGGGDSVGLLHALLKIGRAIGFTVEAAHVNHSLRGAESDGDEAFVRRLCGELGVALTVERLREGEVESADGSLETAARRFRLDILSRLAAGRGAKRIALGHTRDDQAETVLQRIIRGTGPAGLAGIAPMRDRLWIRPFLEVSRKEVRDYLERSGLSCREDSSNRDPAFVRNRIRNELIPFIEERFSPAAVPSIARLADLSRVQDEYIEEKVSEACGECRLVWNRHRILLDTRRLLSYHELLIQRVIRRCLAVLGGIDRDADRGEIERIRSLIAKGRGELTISKHLQVGAGNTALAFVTSFEPWTPVSLETSGVTEIPCGGGSIIAENAGIDTPVDGCMRILFDSSVIADYGPLSVGPVKRGERMIPFGMREAVKIIDLLSLSPLPKLLRKHAHVVRAGGVPLWIPGLRSSELLRIDRDDAAPALERTITLLTFEGGIRWVERIETRDNENGAARR